MVSGLGRPTQSAPRASVIIAAHNEAAVIGSCLNSLRVGVTTDLDVVVVPNGCTDDTAGVAQQSAGVRVVVEPTPGKANALNAGDRAVKTFPRVYLDADIIVDPGCLDALVSALSRDGKLVAVPGRRLETAGRPLLVRAYFAIQSRLPVFATGLFGRGMIAVSEEGRARFSEFPLMVADDLFLDSIFTAGERCVVDGATVTVDTPLRTTDLVRRLTRVRRGNQAMRLAGTAGEIEGTVRASDRWSWFVDVVRPRPWLAPAGVVYVVFTVTAGVLSRRGNNPLDWGRAEDARSAATSGGDR